MIRGSATIDNEEKNGTSMSFEFSKVSGIATIELPYIYYLGYQVEVEDNNGNIQKLETFESDNGFVAFELTDVQEGMVRVKYTGTALMIASYIISIVTFAGVITFLIVIKISEHKKALK